MLVAYENRGLQIEEIPPEEIMIFQHPVAEHAEALRILAEAEKQRPDVRWVIVGIRTLGRSRGTLKRQATNRVINEH
jgi:hypothetical protein